MRQTTRTIAGLLILLALRAGGPPAHAEPVPLEDRDRTFVAGRAALEDGLYELAQKKFAEYTDKQFFRKKRALGTFYLVQALQAQGKHGEIADWLSRHLAWAEDTAVEGGLNYFYAVSLEALQRDEEALSLLRRFDENFPGDPYLARALALRARLLVKAGRVEEAIAQYADLQARLPEAAEAADNLLAWARLHLGRGEEAESLRILRILADRHPGSVAASAGRLWIGNILAGQGARVEAADQFTALAAETNASPDLVASAWYGLASIREAETNRAAAISAYATGAEKAKDPALVLAGRVERARLLRLSGQAGEAAQLLGETVRAFPAHPAIGAAQMELAQSLSDVGRPAEALEVYQQYLEAFTERQGEALLGKGWCLWQLARYAEAASVFARAAAVVQEPAQREAAQRKSADALFADGKYKLAGEEYRKWLVDFPKSADAAAVLGSVAEADARLGEFAKAEAGFRALINQYPESDEAERALLRIARLYEERGDWEEAGKAYEDLLLSYTNSALRVNALSGLAMSRYRSGLFAEAQTGFARILDQFPATEWAEQAYFMRGYCQYLQGNSKEALETCHTFLEKFPQSRFAPDVAFWIGEYQYNRAAYADAETIFLELVRRYPGAAAAADALFWAGRAAAEQSDYRRAIAYYNRVAKEYTDSVRLVEARFAQGDALSELGEFSGAILAFDEIIRNHPGSPMADRALGRRGDCQFMLGGDKAARYEEALQSYRDLMDSPTASPELKLQAEFKLGRTYEKLGRKAEALEHYMNVAYTWLQARDNGAGLDVIWFTRSAFAAAAMKEAEGRPDEAIRIYSRVVDAGVPAGADAQRQIDKLRAAAKEPGK